MSTETTQTENSGSDAELLAMQKKELAELRQRFDPWAISRQIRLVAVVAVVGVVAAWLIPRLIQKYSPADTMVAVVVLGWIACAVTLRIVRTKPNNLSPGIALAEFTDPALLNDLLQVPAECWPGGLKGKRAAVASISVELTRSSAQALSSDSRLRLRLWIERLYYHDGSPTAVDQVRHFAAALMLCSVEADLSSLKRIRFVGVGRETETRIEIRSVIQETIAEWELRRSAPEGELLRAAGQPGAALLRPAEEPGDRLQGELLRPNSDP